MIIKKFLHKVAIIPNARTVFEVKTQDYAVK